MVTAANPSATAFDWTVEHTWHASGLQPVSAVVCKTTTELGARTYLANTVHHCGLSRGQEYRIRDAAGVVVCRVWRDA